MTLSRSPRGPWCISSQFNGMALFFLLVLLFGKVINSSPFLSELESSIIHNCQIKFLTFENCKQQKAIRSSDYFLFSCRRRQCNAIMDIAWLQIVVKCKIQKQSHSKLQIVVQTKTRFVFQSQIYGPFNSLCLLFSGSNLK